MPILISKLLFSIPNPKFICGQILAKKVKIITFMITFMILFSPSRLHYYYWGTLYLMLYLCFVSLYYYRKKSQSCSFCWKIGIQSISKMLILIPASDPFFNFDLIKFWTQTYGEIFWQISAEKVKVARCAWKSNE